MGTNVHADLAVSVHGPAGVLDLMVPAGVVALDVAEEYARQVGLASVPALCTRVGAVLPPDRPLARAGVRTGDVLVATTDVVPARTRGHRDPGRAGYAEREPGPVPVVVGWVAAACALVAGGSVATGGSEALRGAVVAALVLGAALGVAPLGRRAGPRRVVAPAFAAAAALVLAWDPQPAGWPLVLGVCGLVAAIAAALARALDPVGADEAADDMLLVWVVAGASVFALTGAATLAGAPARVTWSALLVLAVLAAGAVPGLVVDVPDQHLLDLDRLAVTAWSARARPIGRRGRTVVSRSGVGAVASRGARLLTAASAAVGGLAVVSAPALLAAATLPVDRIGARILVAAAGATLLLAARSHRHRAARMLLRSSGLVCLVLVAAVLLGSAVDSRGGFALSVVAVGTGAAVVVAAVATGRGWRSAWWSRRAEVAEGLCGAVTLAASVVASGWLRQVWETASLWNLGS